MMGELPLRTECDLANGRMLTVGTDDYVDLPFSTVLELDADAFTIGH
jgi:hypothetical protein